jgi:hypothetical protein
VSCGLLSIGYTSRQGLCARPPSQINNAVAAHRSFIESLKNHATQARDPRFRELCQQYIPSMTQHHGMLEQYQSSIGAGEGTLKKAVGGFVSTAREWVEAAAGDDYMALVGDIVMGRQLEDTFKTFREGGRVLQDERLERLGDTGEADHDRYVRDANRLVPQLFVEQVRSPRSPWRGRTRPREQAVFRGQAVELRHRL